MLSLENMQVVKIFERSEIQDQDLILVRKSLLPDELEIVVESGQATETDLKP